mgnify:CR=1 FL=1
MKYILQNDKDSFLKIALDSYRCCLATGDKYDLRVVYAFGSVVPIRKSSFTINGPFHESSFYMLWSAGFQNHIPLV